MKVLLIKKLLIVLVLFPSIVFAADISLLWDAPTSSEISHYELYISSTSGGQDYTQPGINVGNVTEYTHTFEDGAVYYVTCITVNNYGRKSSPSNELVVHLDGPRYVDPNPPTNLRAVVL